MTSTSNIHSKRTGSIHRRQYPTFNTTKTPFCAVCKDAGRSDFNTHFVRDRPGGNVVCQYLLSLECGYCGEQGHTPSHCPVLKRQNSEALEQRRQEEHGHRKPRIADDGFMPVSRRGAPVRSARIVAPNVGQKRKNAGGFAALADDSDDERDDENIHDEPTGLRTQEIVAPVLSGWLAAVAAPAASSMASRGTIINVKRGNSSSKPQQPTDWRRVQTMERQIQTLEHQKTATNMSLHDEKSVLSKIERLKKLIKDAKVVLTAASSAAPKPKHVPAAPKRAVFVVPAAHVPAAPKPAAPKRAVFVVPAASGSNDAWSDSDDEDDAPVTKRIGRGIGSIKNGSWADECESDSDNED
jgi:hypothetical protein